MAYNLGDAEGKIKISSAGVRKGVEESEGLLGRLADSTANSAKVMTTALLGVGLAVAGSLTAVAISGISMAADLEEQMSGVKAVMGATDEQVGMLKDHILDLGLSPDLKVSTMEAAEAVEMLGRNGLSTDEILQGAAESTVMLANATGGTFAQAADIATDIMALFNIKASDMERAVDGVTAVVNNSKWSIDDYEYALASAGGVAATSGVDFDDLNTSIAVMAPYFNSGRTAGTSLKTMITRLAAPTNVAKEAMDELGISVYDTDGNMISMNEIAIQLNNALYGQADAYVEVGGRTAEQNSVLAALQKQYDTTAKKISDYKNGVLGINLTEEKRADVISGLTDELGLYQARMDPLLAIQGEMASVTLPALTEQERSAALEAMFGADAYRAAAAMAEAGVVAYTDLDTAAEELGVSQDTLNKYMDGGITHFEAMQAQMDETSAAENAKIRMDNFRGALEILGGVIETVKIKLGEKFLPILTSIARAAAEFVEKHGDKFIEIFDKIAEIIDAFVSGAPSDYPWEDIFPPWLADVAYAISDAYETVLETLRNGEGVVEAALGGLEALGVDASILDKIREFGGALKEFFVDNREAIIEGLKAVGLAIAGFAGLTILGVIAGILISMVNPLTIILALIGLLITAWSGNWGGVQDKVVAIKGVFDEFFGRLESGEGIVSSILSVLEGLGVPTETLDKLREFGEIISGIGDYFGEVLSGGEEAEGFLQRLPEPIQPVVDALGEMLSAWQDTGGEIKEFLEGAGARVQEWFEENRPLIEEFAEVIGGALGVAAGILTIVFAKISTAIAKSWTFIEPILEGLLELILGLATTVMQMATGDWDGAWQTIQDTVAVVWEKIQEAIFAFTDWILEWFGTSFAELEGKWYELWERIKAIPGEIWITIQEKLAEAWAALLEWFAGVWESFQEAWAGFWQSIADKVNEIWEGIKEYLIGLVRTIVEAMGLDWEEFKTKIETIWNDIVLIATTIWERLVTTISEKVESVRATVEEKINLLKATWDAVWQLVSDFLTTIWEGIFGKVEEKTGEVKGSVETFLTEVQAKWDEIWGAIKTKLEEIWQSIVDVVGPKLEEVKTTISTKIEEARAAIEGFIEPFMTVGSAIIDGIKQGVLNAAGGLLTAALEAVQGALDGVKEFLGIESPSTAFAELGGFSMEGLAQGLRENGQAATIAAQEMGVKMLNGLMEGLISLQLMTEERLIETNLIWTNFWDVLIAGMVEKWAQIMLTNDENLAALLTSNTSVLESVRQIWNSKWGLVYAELVLWMNQIEVLILQKLLYLKVLLEEKLTEIYYTLKSQAGRFREVGQSMVNGMIAGVQSRAGALARAAAAAAAAAFAAAQAEIDSHSPSKKFAKLGVWSMQGLELGFISMIGSVKKTTAGIARAARLSFERGLQGGGAADLLRSSMPLAAMLSGAAAGAGAGSPRSVDSSSSRVIHVYGDVITQSGNGGSLFQELMDLE